MDRVLKGWSRVVLLVGILAVATAVALPLTGRTAGKIYKDGVTTGISDADDHGYGMAVLVIKDDKIVRVTLSEITQFGEPKDYDKYPWPAAKEAKEKLEKDFVANNGPQVDVYAKATSSSRKWIQAVERALAKARVTPESKAKYFEGTFFGKSKADSHGYAVAWVTVENDKIKAVRLDEVTDGKFKDWKNYSYKVAVTARDEMQKRFVGKSSVAEIEQVDVVTGATNSGNKYKEAVANALKAAER
ncbi:MAG TPA: FMN-binding protein [Firmicutes bacterium]|nr:FMN-binding protein [Bacillota bacterium]